MKITIEIDAKAADVENAVNVISNLYNGRNCMRQGDIASKRTPTAYEEEQFAGLALATTIVKLSGKAVTNAV